MSVEDIAYKEFLDNIARLTPKNSQKESLSERHVEEVSNELVMSDIGDDELLKILRKYRLKLPEFTPELLKETAVLIQTIKVTALMETSDNWKEFTELNEKRRTKKNSKKTEETGFDKVLKGIMQVPKPTKDKK